MTKKWHKGPPPSMGWWPTRIQGRFQSIRWWMGEYWSLPAYEWNDAEHAGFVASVQTLASQSDIQWTARPKSWPARSRK